MLRYLVEEELASRGERLKAYSIGVDVLGKAENFDPSNDSSVRVAMHKLRLAMDLYLTSAASTDDRVRIELKPHSYRPEISVKAEKERADEGRRRSARKGTATAILLVTIILAACVSWFLQRSGTPHASAHLSPTVRIMISESEKGNALLNSFVNTLVVLHYDRMQVTLKMTGEADYFLLLSSYEADDSRPMMFVRLYQSDGTLVASETYPLPNGNNQANLMNLASEVNGDFLKFGAIMPRDFAQNPVFDATRRKIFTCYQNLVLWEQGEADVPNYAETLDCLDPGLVTDPKDKAAIYIMRASLMAEGSAGLIATPRPVTITDARRELDRASHEVTDRKRYIAQLIVIDWRDPDRDTDQFRATLEEALQQPLDPELRYILATSYAYFLDNWTKGEEILPRSTLSGGDGTSPPSKSMSAFVFVPGDLARSEYRQAQADLARTGAESTPIYAVLELVIGCGAQEEDTIDAALTRIDAHPELTRETVGSYIVDKAYGPRLERLMLDTISNDMCGSLVS